MAKLVIAFIRREKLKEVKKGLKEIGVTITTIIPAYGRGGEKGIELAYRGKPVS